MEKKALFTSPMHNFQQNIGTQINIGTVMGNYIQHVDNLYYGITPDPQEEEESPVEVETAVGAEAMEKPLVPKNKGGRPKEELFVGDGAAHADEEAVRFRNFLVNRGESLEVKDGKRDTFIYRAFAAFYRKWAEKGWVKPISDACRPVCGPACFEFLSRKCGIEFSKDKTERHYGNTLQKLVSDIPDYELRDIRAEVSLAFA